MFYKAGHIKVWHSRVAENNRHLHRRVEKRGAVGVKGLE